MRPSSPRRERSELVVEPRHEAAAIGLVIADLHRRAIVDRNEGFVGQVLALQEQRQAIQRAILEVIADLRVNNGLLQRPAQFTLATKAHKHTLER